MHVDLKVVMQLLRDGVAVRGTEGGLAVRRTVPLVEEFDTEIRPSEIDEDTHLPIPFALISSAPINWGDVVLLMPERPLRFFFAYPPAEPGGITIGAGGVLLIVGGQLRSDPPVDGVVFVQNTETEPVRLRGLVGGSLVPPT